MSSRKLVGIVVVALLAAVSIAAGLEPLNGFPSRCRQCTAPSGGSGGGGGSLDGGGVNTQVAVWTGSNTLSGDGGLVYAGGVLGVDSTSALDSNVLAFQLGDKTQINTYAVGSFFNGTGLEKVFGFNNSDNSTGLAAGVSSQLLETTLLDSFGEYTPFYGEIHASSTDNFYLDGGSSNAFIYGADFEVYADHDAGSLSQIAGLFTNSVNNKTGFVAEIDGIEGTAGISHNGTATNIYGGRFSAYANPGTFSGNMYGFSGTAQIAGASDAGGDVVGVFAKGYEQDSAHTTGNIYGLVAQASTVAASTGLSTANSIVAGKFSPNNSGARTVGSVEGVHVDTETGSGGATNLYGVYIDNQASATATNKYAWYYNSSTPTYVDSSGNIVIGEANSLYLNGSTATSWIQGGSSVHNILMQSAVANSSTNVACVMDTNVALSGSTKLLSLRNHTAEKFSVDNTGIVNASGEFFAPPAGYALAGNQVLHDIGSFKLELKGYTNDSASSVGLTLNSGGALTTLGAKVVSFQNNGTEKLSIDKDGNLLSASHITCSMSASTTCTQTVPTGSVCQCQATSGAVSPVSCAVSSTTATCTASGSNSATWNIFVY